MALKQTKPLKHMTSSIFATRQLCGGEVKQGALQQAYFRLFQSHLLDGLIACGP